MLIPLKSTLLVLVMMSNTSVPICNRFHDRQANRKKITTFRGFTYLTPTCADILERRGKITCASCLGPSPTIFMQFTLEMCITARNRKKFTETPYFEDSGSFKVINVDISKKLDARACYDKQHVCAYLQPFSCSTSQYR